MANGLLKQAQIVKDLDLIKKIIINTASRWALDHYMELESKYYSGKIEVCHKTNSLKIKN